MKLYFSKEIGDEFCYPKAEIIEYMKENDISEMEVTEAEMETDTVYFYCREFQEIGDVGQGCGRMCKKYAPRNGKNGRCKHSANPYSKSYRKLTIIIKP